MVSDPPSVPIVPDPLPPRLYSPTFSTGNEKETEPCQMFPHLQPHKLKKTPKNFTKTFNSPPKMLLVAAAVPMGEVGRTAGDVVAMKSAICRRAQMWDELFPFFICSWMRLSSSSLKDCNVPWCHLPQGGDTMTQQGWSGGIAVGAPLDRWWWHHQLGGSGTTGLVRRGWWHHH